MGDLDIASEKPKIVVDCGVHAREWIGPAACRQFIHEMLHNVGYPADRKTDDSSRDLSDNPNSMAEDPYTKAEMVELFDEFNWFVILRTVSKTHMKKKLEVFENHKEFKSRWLSIQPRC